MDPGSRVQLRLSPEPVAGIFQGWGSDCEKDATLPESSKVPEEPGKGKGLILLRHDSAQ